MVEMIEALYLEGSFTNCELFLLTDNIVLDYEFYKGYSSSKHYFELILRLRKLDMDGEIIIHLVYISGKRMIDSGVDGLFREDITKGVPKLGSLRKNPSHNRLGKILVDRERDTTSYDPG